MQNDPERMRQKQIIKRWINIGTFFWKSAKCCHHFVIVYLFFNKVLKSSSPESWFPSWLLQTYQPPAAKYQQHRIQQNHISRLLYNMNSFLLLMLQYVKEIQNNTVQCKYSHTENKLGLKKTIWIGHSVVWKEKSVHWRIKPVHLQADVLQQRQPVAMFKGTALGTLGNTHLFLTLLCLFVNYRTRAERETHIQTGRGWNSQLGLPLWQLYTPIANVTSG